MPAMHIPALMVVTAMTSSPAPKEPPAVMVSPTDTPDQVIAKAVQVVPSSRQLTWQRTEFAGFVHFGMNTFTDREWGEGTEDPGLFSPADLDARQWVEAMKAAGIRMLILTAKHHDGFCLWPSRYTEHSVRNSPWRGGKGDLVRQVSQACREGGLKFGFYLSPWDRHEPTYGDSPRYNEYFVNQLRELLTGYGPVADVWFDGACGEGPNGKRQVYDWVAFWSTVRELQPEATISIMGPDVRWCGNEAGHSRASEWSVLPLVGADDRPLWQSEADVAAITSVNCQAEGIGTREQLLAAAKQGARLVWYPSQVDVSIRPGWFYHASEDGQVKSLSHLLDIYYGSVGGNNQLLLNIPPDRRGRIHENDVERLKELGDTLRETFAHNFAWGAMGTVSAEGRATSFEYRLGRPRAFSVARLKEDILRGQRVEEFVLEAWVDGDWREIAHSTTVGYQRLLRFPEVTAERARVRILKSRAAPKLAAFGLFREP
jgi:alpha-L-fucosidase